MTKYQNEPKSKIFYLGFFFLRTDLCFPYVKLQEKLQENCGFKPAECFNLLKNIINLFQMVTDMGQNLQKSYIVQFNSEHDKNLNFQAKMTNSILILQ